MADRLKGLLNKVLEWWNKFTAKQKTIIISAAAGIVLAIAILATVLTRLICILDTVRDDKTSIAGSGAAGRRRNYL